MALLSGWTYRKEITVTNASADYQTKVLVGESAGATGEDVDCGGHVAADFDDLRFTAADGTTLLDYWIESITGSTPNCLATVWVKNNATPDTTLYMYYGGTETAVSNGADTFIQFEDFEWGDDEDPVADDGGSIDWTVTAAGTSKVEIDTAQQVSGTRSARFYRDGTNYARIVCAQAASGSVAIRYRVRKDETSKAIINHGNDTYRIYVAIAEDEKIYYYDTGNKDTGSTVSVDTWYLFEVRNIDWVAATYDIYLDDALIQAAAVMETSASNDGVLHLYNYTGTSEVWLDDFIIRKWAATEPSFAFGDESAHYSRVLSIKSSLSSDLTIASTIGTDLTIKSTIGTDLSIESTIEVH